MGGAKSGSGESEVVVQTNVMFRGDLEVSAVCFESCFECCHELVKWNVCPGFTVLSVSNELKKKTKNVCLNFASHFLETYLLKTNQKPTKGKLIGHIIHWKHCLLDGVKPDEPALGSVETIQLACLVALSSFILQIDSSLFTLPVFVPFPPLSAPPRWFFPQHLSHVNLSLILQVTVCDFSLYYKNIIRSREKCCPWKVPLVANANGCFSSLLTGKRSTMLLPTDQILILTQQIRWLQQNYSHSFFFYHVSPSEKEFSVLHNLLLKAGTSHS